MAAPAGAAGRDGLALTCVVPIGTVSCVTLPLHLSHSRSQLPRPFNNLLQDLQQHMQLLWYPARPIGSSPHDLHMTTYAEPPKYAGLVGERPSKLISPR